MFGLLLVYIRADTSIYVWAHYIHTDDRSELTTYRQVMEVN
jgi:hypothetical protein